MKILNVIWGFGTGGIGKLFLTYSTLGKSDPNLDMSSVCIDLQNCEYDRKPLTEFNIKVIKIRNRADFSWIKALSKIADEIMPDAVFCHGFNGPIIVRLAAIKCKYLRVPMICTYHGLYNPPTRHRRFIADLINRLQVWMYIKYAYRVILVSNYSGKYLLSHNVPKVKMVVIYNGISKIQEPITKVDLPHDGVNIIMTGRLDVIKGLHYLIDAIPLIMQNTTKSFHIYVIGDGPAKAALMNQVKSLDVTEQISFQGYQSNVEEWLEACDIFCLPSLQENHSIALLEAMRSGKAIVCTDVGGNTETVINGEDALVVPSKNSYALADALVKMINSEQLRTRYAENARRRFEKYFTEDIMKTKLCDVLKSIKI